VALKVRYIFEQSLRVEAELVLQPDEVTALRDAVTEAERHEVLDPLIAAAAMESPASEGMHMRQIDFAVFADDS
jgi:hypothetical protein